MDLPDDAPLHQLGVGGDDEADDFTQREKLARGFARDFREPPDQILEQGAGRDIANAVGMQVDLRETVEHLPKNAAPAKALQSFGEQELVEENVTDVAGKLGDAVDQVVEQLVRILCLQAFEGARAEDYKL